MSIALRDFDSINCPGIDETVRCKPEIFEYTRPANPPSVTRQRYRVLLVGKVGRRGYAEEPALLHERHDGEDGLGAERWVSCGELSDSTIAAVMEARRVIHSAKRAAEDATQETKVVLRDKNEQSAKLVDLERRVKEAVRLVSDAKATLQSRDGTGSGIEFTDAIESLTDAIDVLTASSSNERYDE